MISSDVIVKLTAFVQFYSISVTEWSSDINCVKRSFSCFSPSLMNVSWSRRPPTTHNLACYALLEPKISLWAHQTLSNTIIPYSRVPYAAHCESILYSSHSLLIQTLSRSPIFSLPLIFSHFFFSLFIIIINLFTLHLSCICRNKYSDMITPYRYLFQTI